jgi:hypothetical protein
MQRAVGTDSEQVDELAGGGENLAADHQQRFAQNRWIGLDQLFQPGLLGKANAPTRTGALESTRHSPIASAMPVPHFARSRIDHGAHRGPAAVAVQEAISS